MGDTNIEWTDKVWNCVTGCTKVSAGCKNCYAERMFHRPYPGRAFTDVQCHPERLDQPRHWRKPCRIFVNSISDLFHEVIPDRFITEIFQAMRGSPQHTFQILTKRPAQMHELLARVKRWEGWYTLDGEEPKGYRGNAAIMGDDENWPLPNVWLGVSVEDQKTADERIPLLLKTPAKVRFVSYEPTLGPLDFQKVPVIHDPDCECNPEYMCASFPGRWCAVCGHAASQHLADGSNCCCASCPDHEWEEGQRGIGVDWVIAGSESGPEARRYDLEWFRSMRDQCKVAGTSFFMKQITLKGRKTMPESYALVVRMIPPSVNAYVRHTRAGRHYKTAETEAFMQAFALAWKQAGAWKIRAEHYDVSMRIWLGKRDRGDIDNFCKIPIDALVRCGAIDTDSKVNELHVSLDRDWEAPRTIVEVRPKGELDSQLHGSSIGEIQSLNQEKSALLPTHKCGGIRAGRFQ